jgi:hypothetical protein
MADHRAEIDLAFTPFSTATWASARRRTETRERRSLRGVVDVIRYVAY